MGKSPAAALFVFFAFLVPVLADPVVSAEESAGAGGEESCCPCPQKEAAQAKPSKSSKDPTFGLPVAGGPNADRAEPLELNRDYKLNHHQKKGSKDYFYLKLKPGAEITLGLKAFEKGIDLAGSRPRETGTPYARVELQDPEGRNVAALSIDAQPRQLRRASYKVAQAGRYVLAVGSDAGDMHKDQTVFKVSLVPRVLDCPGPERDPVVLDADGNHEDCLGGSESAGPDDPADRFRFRAEKREVYRIEAAMPEGTPADLRAKLTFQNRLKKIKPLAEASGSGGRVTLESVRMPQDGDYFLEVSLAKPLKETVPYTLTVTKISDR